MGRERGIERGGRERAGRERGGEREGGRERERERGRERGRERDVGGGGGRHAVDHQHAHLVPGTREKSLNVSVRRHDTGSTSCSDQLLRSSLSRRNTCYAITSKSHIAF